MQEPNRNQDRLAIALMVATALLLLTIFWLQDDHGAKAGITANPTNETDFAFSTAELPDAGVYDRDTATMDVSGKIDQVRIFKTGTACTSVTCWLLDADVSATTTTRAVLLKATHSATDQGVYQPAGGPIRFKAQSGKTIAVQCLANGGECAADVGVIWTPMEQE